MKAYTDKARQLLSEMSVEEKIHQLTSDINLEYAEELYDADGNYLGRPDPLCGTFRNPAHFMHNKLGRAASAGEACELINEDVRRATEAQPHHIPPIEQGEALHGASWGMATQFPQPIALASSFDTEMQARIGDAIGKECACVGVRQVFSPVINLVRDCRWGRTVETYGEDVRLTSDMAAEMCRGLEKNGVIATPKHFCDNFADGGRDSNYSDNSERTMREYYLVPFKACFDAGAQSTMAAYNSWEGIPCHANKRLLTGILRDEWGFTGFVVSDYCGVESMNSSHYYAKDPADAAAKAIKAGLDNITCMNLYKDVKHAYDTGLLSEEDIDRSVLRILEAKFRLGLFDDPYRDPDKAMKTVRCAEHRKLALESARETIVLLKNDGILPADKEKVRRIGVFGQSADIVPVGSNYSGAFNFPWQGDDAPTPLEALRDLLGEGAEVLYCESAEIEKIAPTCDLNIYFTSLVEGEGADRCSIRLPSVTVHTERKDDGGLIVDTREQVIHEDQEESIRRLFRANRNSCVVLLNGAPVDMTSWIGSAGAVIEAWYPGEQGAKALAEIIFGITNPSGKLPITFPRSVGQLPLYYSRKPSGRGYAYCDDDGTPLFPFGYGLSYTTFEISECRLSVNGTGADLTFKVRNTGDRDGCEVIQLYLGSKFCETVRPLKELKAYCRVSVNKGCEKEASLHLGEEDFFYYDAGMVPGLHDGDHTLMLGTSSEDIKYEFQVYAREGRLCEDKR